MGIEDRLISFIESNEPGALILQGTWGRGKTHLWDSLLKQPSVRVGDATRNYAYASLFGVNSLDELKTQLYLVTDSLPTAVEEKEEITEAAASKSWWRLHKAKEAVREGQKIVAENLQISHVSALGKIFNAYAFYRVRNMLVCLDDIERRGNGLHLKEVMGLVSMLWEQRGCRVLLILNSSSLSADDQKIWDENKEKVFQGEVTFEPSAESCVKVKFDPQSADTYFIAARAALLELDITNIRIIARAKDAIERVRGHLENITASDYTKERISRTLVWAVYCHSGRGEGSPPLEEPGFLHQVARLLSDKDTRTDDEKRWDTMRDKYRPQSDTDLDRALNQSVIKGYVDTDAMRRAVVAFDERALEDQARQRFEDVWSDFHDVFVDNRNDIVAAFRQHFPQAVGAISAMTLDSTVWLLRELGEGAVADEFIQKWVGARGGSRSKELSPRIVYKFGSLKDAAFMAAIDAAHATPQYLPSLPQAFTILGSREGDMEDAIDAISRTGVADVVHYLESNSGKVLSDAVRYCLTLRAVQQHPHYAQAGQVVHDALCVIGRKSAFSAFRIEHGYKIDVHGAATAPAVSE